MMVVAFVRPTQINDSNEGIYPPEQTLWVVIQRAMLEEKIYLALVINAILVSRINSLLILVFSAICNTS